MVLYLDPLEKVFAKPATASTAAGASVGFSPDGSTCKLYTLKLHRGSAWTHSMSGKLDS